MNFYKLIGRITKVTNAYAHCDIPCEIYDPKSAKIAAQTVLKMTIKRKK